MRAARGFELRLDARHALLCLVPFEVALEHGVELLELGLRKNGALASATTNRKTVDLLHEDLVRQRANLRNGRDCTPAGAQRGW